MNRDLGDFLIQGNKEDRYLITLTSVYFCTFESWKIMS